MSKKVTVVIQDMVDAVKKNKAEPWAELGMSRRTFFNNMQRLRISLATLRYLATVTEPSFTATVVPKVPERTIRSSVPETFGGMDFTLEQVNYLQKHVGVLKDLTGLVRYLKDSDPKTTLINLLPKDFKQY